MKVSLMVYPGSPGFFCLLVCRPVSDGFIFTNKVRYQIFIGQGLVYISPAVTLKYSEFQTENYLLYMIPKIDKDYFSVQH